MADDRATYVQFLDQVIQHPGVSAAFADGAMRHREMELDFNTKLTEICPSGGAITFPHMELSAPAYWQRNFFSILFLSIFDALGIAPKRQHLYGMVLHAVRGIVTATDNILDEEAKGSVLLQLRGGKVLPNVLVILMESGVLHQAIRELSDDPQRVHATWKALVASLFALGSEESSEEGAIETVLEPKRLLDEIHAFRGGGLLQLAFIVPRANEPQLADGIARAMSGVNHVGLSLQIMDDITDFEEDLRNRNHNMLRSWIVHRQPDGPCTDADLSALDDAALEAPEQHFPQATEQVMVMSVEMALRGFAILNALGHPADRSAALRLIEAMFKLRGLERLWAVYERASKAPNTKGSPSVDYAQYFPALQTP